MNQSEIEIEKKYGLKPSQCGCQNCVKMCLTAPCLPTMEDITKIVKAGYGKLLAPTVLMWPVLLGIRKKPVQIIGQIFDNGRCSFLSADNKCILHSKGLKPLDGRYAHHSDQGDGYKELVSDILKTWEP